VVYRALDTRLNRPVAVKVLSRELADAHARRRFQREAQMASSLNHPHIVTVYDAGEIEGRQYLVTEFVDGGTLRDWAKSENPTSRRIVDLLVGVADGLAAAHGAGILHRDIKPANILITRSGYAKLADFGLAKLADSTEGLDSDVRTLTEGLTRPGMVIGTIAYMSPEQAAGKPLDARSDIFSFGVVLYELLAGRRAFFGSTDLEVLQKVMHNPAAPLDASVPAGLRMLVEKALEKDPAERYQTMREVVIDLRRLAKQAAQGVEPVASPTTVPARRSPILWMALAGLTLALGLLAGRWLWFRPATIARDVRFQRITDFIGIEESPAISPDGKTVAFVAPAGGRQQIWVRLLAGGIPLQITHDDFDHVQPRWAPDSSSLIYFSPATSAGGQGTIWELSALGGSPRRIAAALTAGDISHDGRRIAAFQSSDKDMQLVVIARDGSGVQPVERLSSLCDRPRWSPDDRWIAFHRGVLNAFDEGILIIAATGGEPRTVAHGDTMRGMSWLPDGSGFVYSSSSGSTILYPPIFNLRTIRKDGSAERQLTFGDASYVEPDVSAPGKLVASQIHSQSDIWEFPVAGSPQENTRGGVRITRQTAQVRVPSVSPDGKELVYLSDSGGHGNLWIAKIDGSGVRQVTSETDPATSIGLPIWSPKGDHIVFILTRQGNTAEWLVNPDGSGLHQFVAGGTNATWSPDGRLLYYEVRRGEARCIEKTGLDSGTVIRVLCGGLSIPMAVSIDGSTLYYADGPTLGWEIRKAQPENGQAHVIGRIPAFRIPGDPNLWQQTLSPDGKWLAAPLVDRGTTNLWMMPADGGPMRQLTDFGERSILIMRRVSWSPDSKHLFAAMDENGADIILLDGLLP
jgi:Tol biopolymer transport system component